MTIAQAARKSLTVWMAVKKIEEWPNHLGITLHLKDGRDVEIWDLANCWKISAPLTEEADTELCRKGFDPSWPVRVLCVPIGTDPIKAARLCDEHGHLILNTSLADGVPSRDELLDKWKELTAQTSLFDS